ncbi:hypothetical protein EVAR_92213_1 [Eumeta japonica]|uniref:Uncharacterized protein n=1 Tax=Eumeta variegata TaxID=151549 RepID=A0A4C1TLW0_EUMVA|nr:hypothetical protein EVAR_92213_1 [Eumeta japonica]
MNYQILDSTCGFACLEIGGSREAGQWAATTAPPPAAVSLINDVICLERGARPRLTPGEEKAQFKDGPYKSNADFRGSAMKASGSSQRRFRLRFSARE